MTNLGSVQKANQAPNWSAPNHFTADGIGAVCGSSTAYSLAFDPEDPAIGCAKCRLYLKGYRAGKAAR